MELRELAEYTQEFETTSLAVERLTTEISHLHAQQAGGAVD
jgi:hypothetical protein